MSKESNKSEEPSMEKKLEDLVLKANELGIVFKSGPATFETINDEKVFHVLEEMTDDIFYDSLLKKVEYFESKKFLKVLKKHSFFGDTKDGLLFS